VHGTRSRTPPAEEPSARCRRAVGALEATGDLRVMACDGTGRPDATSPVTAGASLAVVGTREACDRLLRER